MMTRLRALLFGLGLLPLAGCAEMNLTFDGQPTALACPVEESLALRRQRMVSTALDEWQKFGGGVIDWSNGRREVLAEGIKETDPGVASNLRRYWRAVPTPLGQQAAANEGRAGPLDAPFSQAWSAAFIGYLACAAGVPATDLPRHEAHFTYLDAALDGTPGFQAEALEEAPPEPGDIICGDRSAQEARLLSLFDRRGEQGVPRPLHCDLVVEVRGQQIRAIGGNVNDSVTLSLYPTDREGRLVRLVIAEAPGWFAVLRASYPPLPETVSQR